MRSVLMNFVFIVFVGLIIGSNAVDEPDEEITPPLVLDDGIFIPEDTTILPMPIGAFTEFPPILEGNTNEDSTYSFTTETEMSFPWEITEEGTDATAIELPYNQNISSSLETSNPTFQRPYGDSGLYYYDVFEIQASFNGYFSFESKSSMDTVAYIYYDSFDERYPFYWHSWDDDEGGEGQFRLFTYLEDDRTYQLVVTTKDPQVTGNYEMIVKGLHSFTIKRIMAATRGINGILRRYRRFRRPGGIYPSYFFSVYQVIVRRSGYYTFTSNSTVHLLGYLYVNNFYAGQSSTNLLASGTDNQENGQFRVRTYLSSPRTYYFVVTTVDRRVTTHFRLSVTGPINALLEPIKSMILTNPTVSSEWTMESEIFRRPYGFGRNHYYQVFEVTVNEKGLYSLICRSTVDSVGYIYENSFNASSPNRNLMTYDDQHAANELFGGNDQFGITLILDKDVTYYLVATTFREFRFGTFDIVVQGEGQATISAVNNNR